MNEITTSNYAGYGTGFIPGEFIPRGKDEYYIRNEQCGFPPSHWRKITDAEKEMLIKNGNTCEDWGSFYVSDPFQPGFIKNSSFAGLIRIGKIEEKILEHHHLCLPVGITNSRIISADIGDNCALHNVHYCAHYCIGNSVILFNVDELITTPRAQFGNGIIKQGVTGEDPMPLMLINEAGGRSILPFESMIPADAVIWLKYPQDTQLQHRLAEITRAHGDSRQGRYGTIGDFTVIKHCRIIKDVKIGSCAYIKGANTLKNLTILSSIEEPTHIGEGVELAHGIVGFGCRIFYGSKAVHFILGRNTGLQYGARLFHTFVGDNSTISCCEVLHNLIFPAHEQHHNNSFLIASLIMGQSNIAAGACIGSNHNSRANDGEIRAGRGFWPGLNVTLKHSSTFASFVLIAKGNYPGELHIPLPFSLVSNNNANNSLEVIPGYWWLYNMYALERNSWKCKARDKRKQKIQHIEFEYLAPDTIDELFHGMKLLEIWAAKAYLRKAGRLGNTDNLETPGSTPGGTSEEELAGLGKELFHEPGDPVSALKIYGENMENSHRPVVIKKASRGYHSYRQMIHYYAMKRLIVYYKDHPGSTPATMHEALKDAKPSGWVNMGGQIAREKDIHKLCSKISKKELNSWEEIHQAYDRLWESYERDKQRHAYTSLLKLLETNSLTPVLWNEQLTMASKTAAYIRDQAYLTRKKDYDNIFRQATFGSKEEMAAVIPPLEKNSFILSLQKEIDAFLKDIKIIKKGAV